MGERRYGTREYAWTLGQKVSYTGTDGDSTAFSEDTEVALCATTACYITIAAAPTAAASAGSFPLPANVIWHVQVPAGSKISAVQQSSGGDLYILPVK